MKIKLTPNFTRQTIKKQVEKQLERVLRAIKLRFEYTGWEFVKMAREKTRDQGGFGDVTGNLRSSIGFIVVDHGDIVTENFEFANKGTDRATGRLKAKEFAEELSDKYSSGIALIVFAGMEYAAAVESKGRDVITGSSLVAETTLKQAMKRIQDKMKK